MVIKVHRLVYEITLLCYWFSKVLLFGTLNISMLPLNRFLKTVRNKSLRRRRSDRSIDPVGATVRVHLTYASLGQCERRLVFARLTGVPNTQTDHGTCDVCNNRPRLCDALNGA